MSTESSSILHSRYSRPWKLFPEFRLEYRTLYTACDRLRTRTMTMRLDQISSLLSGERCPLRADLDRLLDETVVLLHRDQKRISSEEQRRSAGGAAEYR